MSRHTPLYARCLVLVVLTLNLTSVSTLHDGRPEATGGRDEPRNAGASAVTRRDLAAAPAPTATQPLTFTAGTAAALILAPTVAALSNAAGVGGGAIFVPLFCSLLSLSINAATALSQAVIFGGAVGSLACSITSRHPLHPASPLIDFALALALLPALLLGVTTGVLINMALPAWVLTCLLIPMLVLFAWRTANSGLRMRQAELQAVQNRSQPPQQLQQSVSCSGPAKQQAVELVVQSDGFVCTPPQSPTAEARAPITSSKRSAQPPSPGNVTESQAWNIPAAPAGSRQGQQHFCVSCISADISKQEDDALPSSTHACEVPDARQGSGVLRWHDSPCLMDGVLQLGPLHDLPESSVASDAEQQCSSAASWGHLPCRRASGHEIILRADSQLQRSGSAAPQTEHTVQQQGRVQLPCMLLVEIAMLWFVLIGFQLGKERFQRCSWQYGLLFGIQALLSVALCVLFSWQMVYRQRLRAEEVEPILPDGGQTSAGACSAHPSPGLQGWSRQWLTCASLIALAGGAVAGMLGLGGGMVMAPLMLEMGVHPASAAATSALMVLLSSSTAVIAFAAAHRLNLEYAALFGSTCLVAALVGTYFISRAVRRSGRASYLVLLLALIIAVGALVTAIFSGRLAVLDLMHHTNLGLPHFCV